MWFALVVYLMNVSIHLRSFENHIPIDISRDQLLSSSLSAVHVTPGVLDSGFSPRDPQHLTLSIIKLYPPSCLPFLYPIKVILELSALIFTCDSQIENSIKVG